ncbi:unnamed protein product [Sphenostylis stenocarpa]|uniref:Uncharacterized protein n=1 Tax=Sphenostylis stenocarpa TaxID=92480 RepID=A0AA86VZM9_9FABA|nr:unnamed protein product [Sphenostylis stenocarpa]
MRGQLMHLYDPVAANGQGGLLLADAFSVQAKNRTTDTLSREDLKIPANFEQFKEICVLRNRPETMSIRCRPDALTFVSFELQRSLAEEVVKMGKGNAETVRTRVGPTHGITVRDIIWDAANT